MTEGERTRCDIVYGHQQTIDVSGRRECGGTYHTLSLGGYTAQHDPVVVGGPNPSGWLQKCDRCGVVRVLRG